MQYCHSIPLAWDKSKDFVLNKNEQQHRNPDNILGNMTTKIIKNCQNEVIWNLTRWLSSEGTGYQIC